MAAGERDIAHELWSVIHHRWWLVVLLSLLGGALALSASLMRTPVYAATATLYVTANTGPGGALEAYQGSLASQQRVESYTKLVESDAVLNRAIAGSGLRISVDEARSMLAAYTTPETVLLSISANSPDGDGAVELADSVAASLVDYVNTLETPPGGGEASARLTIVSPATLSEGPISPRITRSTGLGFVFGALVGLAVCFGWERFDNRVRSKEDLGFALGSPVVGSVPADESVGNGGVLEFSDSGTAATEAYRKLRTNLAFVNVDSEFSLLGVTSPRPGDGKTSTSLNLAASFAELGQRVVVVDCDLRRPTVALRVGANGGVGLADVLSGSASLVDVIQRDRIRDFDLLASGPPVPNPSQLLASEKMGRVLSELREHYDLVICDTPPVLLVADACVVGQRVDGLIVVARAGRTSRKDVADVGSQLSSAGVRVLGSVLNRVPVNPAEYGYAGYSGRGYSGDGIRAHSDLGQFETTTER
ncbi:polysaccharide biosynthesis tyrosine autokinase [Gordonia rhizosphera]|uniref:non-specific protein-tyrosine kinase n=1 Tax=Gordonia rhizosphera NBRC 16068 TaxID=1108045 RepID=K6VWS8_9ACTN|nr:polysaccharide biosynthesis tyrosine autokinase [Gordonia rhizosphera]GAB91340.1 putative protein-tyrosine kinase [Gordonia rhizosphera NBRC 16068]